MKKTIFSITWITRAGKRLQFANWKTTIFKFDKSTTNGQFSIAFCMFTRGYIPSTILTWWRVESKVGDFSSRHWPVEERWRLGHLSANVAKTTAERGWNLLKQHTLVFHSYPWLLYARNETNITQKTWFAWFVRVFLYIEIAHVQMFYEASAIVEVHGPVTDPQELRAKQFIRRISFTQDVHKTCCC